MVDRIVYAGSATEGIIGSPKNTDPYKTTNEADKDLAKVLYSSLVERIPKQNLHVEYVPKLAEKIEVTNDKNIYRITLRKNIFFSNGSPITADDVIYSLLNVPLEKDYSVEKTSDDVLTFKLKKENPDFLENLTYPIIQKNENFENNFSTSMVTSSFFKISSVQKDLNGNVTSIDLIRFNNGEEKLPFLKNYHIKYFKDDVEAYNAFQRKEIDLLSGVPGNTISKIIDDTNIQFDTSLLPNNFAVFFNQNKNEDLRDKNLRQGLSDIVDRESLSNQILGKFGIPEKNILGEKGETKASDQVIDKLSSSFYYKNGVLYRGTKKASETNGSAVKIKLTTIENKELVETAKYLQNSWKKIGIDTEIQVIDRKDLTNIVRDRDFEALLFGFSIKSEKDYYSFFSSKERTYPKLNISNYTSKQTDKILSVLSGENNEARVQDLLKQLSAEIADDNPVIILYKPEFVFAHFLDPKIQLPGIIRSEEDRYVFIENWYTNTEKVLKIFNQSKIINKLDTLLY